MRLGLEAGDDKPVQIMAITAKGANSLRGSAWDLMATGAWFGLVTGLIEGFSRTVLQSVGGVSWDLLMSAASIKVLWVAPLFYLLPFTLVGASLAFLQRIFPRLPMTRAAVFLFSLIGFLDILSSSGRINLLGVCMLALGLAVTLTRWFNTHEIRVLSFWRRSLIWVAALVILAFVGIETGIHLKERSAVAALPPIDPGSPNVLILVVDTLRADHLSLYGYPKKTSPNMEKIAEQAIVFENAMATSSWTLPSHASFLTGLYPSEHGAERFGLSERNISLAEVLQARGYRTGAFSANTFVFSRAFGFGQGFTRFEDSFHSTGDMVSRTFLGRSLQRYVMRYLGFEDVPGRKRASDVNLEWFRWLDRGPTRPFFAVLNYFDAHDPYLPPQPYRGRFSKRLNPGGVLNSFIGRESAYVSTPEILEDEIAAYDGAIAYVDDQIGALVTDLDQRGLSQNTILIITSDHGESFGEHDVFGHGTSLYREQLQVPLILRWQGRIPEGRRLAVPVSLVELPATVMDLIGGDKHSGFRDPSWSHAWTDPSAKVNWPIAVAQLAATPEAKDRKLLPFSGAMKAMVNSKWYYIAHDKFGSQLFDREMDPWQLNSLAGTPEGKIVVADFATRLKNLTGDSLGLIEKSPLRVSE